MVVLDTAVVFELMRPALDPSVASRVGPRTASSLLMAAVAEAELRRGACASIPPDERLEGIAAGLDRMLGTGVVNRVLPFDSDAVRTYAVVAVAQRGLGGFAKAHCPTRRKHE